MAKITRETLLQNLQAYEKEEEKNQTVDVRIREAIWNEVMRRFDAATKRGRHSVDIAYESREFTAQDIDYIKRRAVLEGMRWKWGESCGQYESAYIVLEL